ncbi:phage/plasmid primase, P4 family [Evansella sp. AB-P1]|uniref:phage/plasmid primase, P4 family n=1 Tax=Evansella sp. AB-P1 TaxID=3037653 RepID=UPI00241DE744|nr:phage/plasmid primase, P4 family [Evansella sp. AB-P1]MDG5787797.1 phage/plasmid primase, P4 family [Evansella sp. AB-P1]
MTTQTLKETDASNDIKGLFPSTNVIKIISLIGYSYKNNEQDVHKRYSIAKRPFMKGWQDKNNPGLNHYEINQWLNKKGWIGLLIPPGYDVLDIDEVEEGELIFRALQQENFNFHAIKTNNGFQFIFRSNNRIKTQDAKVLMACGSVGDYRLAERGQIVLPSSNTDGRYWIHQASGELSEMPIYFDRLKRVDHTRPFPIPLSEGGRNNTLYKHACRLVEFGYRDDEMIQITHFLNKYFFRPSLDQREFQNTIHSALKREQSGKSYLQPTGGNSSPPSSRQTEKVAENKNFNLTEIGNAERLVHYHQNKLKYCIEFDEWLIWNGKVWENDKKKQIERIATKTFRQIYKEASTIQDEETRRKLVKWAQSSEKSSILLNSIDRAKAMLPVLQTDLNKDNFKFNCRNGVIDLKTGQLLPHDKDLLITNYSNVEYDPAAECPTWINFIESVMKDEKGIVKQELIEFLQKAIGYTLTGDTREQVLFFLWGSGRNGKSTFINTVKDMLGDYGKQTNADTFTSKTHEGGINNDIARLNDARFVSAVESEEGQRLSESLIKQLTGGEPITARFLRKEFFEFLPQFKIFFTTNHKPIVKGNDEGIWRRIKLIPFTVTIPKEDIDTELPEKLKEELPGILNWAVQGCLKWLQDGLGEPNEVKQATQGYKDEMDILGQFLLDYCVIRPGARSSVKELYDLYKNWCKETGEYELSQRKFNRRLEEKGFIKKRSGKAGNTEFHGIGILDRDFTERTEELKKTEPFQGIPPYENFYGGKGKIDSDTFSSSVTSVEDYVEEKI